MVMFNTPARPLLPPPLGGRVQLSDVLFPLAVAPWLVAGLPGLRRVAGAAGVPAAIWVAAHAMTAAMAVLPGVAWRETAAMAYLGVVMIWGAAVLAEPGHLRLFARWWVVIVAAVVLVGLLGWLATMLSGRPNLLIEWGQAIPVLGDRARIRSTLAPTSRLLITLLIVALPAVFALRRQDELGTRRWYGWLLTVMTVCAVLTYARGLLEFLLVMGLLALLPWRGRRGVLAGALVAVYLVALLGVVGVSTWRVTAHDIKWDADRSRSLQDRSYYATLPDVGVQTLTLRLEWVHANYFTLKRMAWRAFLERPLTGWGPDGWPAIVARAHELGIAPAQLRFASAHGEIFGVAAEMGAIGLVALTVFWVLVLRVMRAARAEGFAGTLARYQALATVGVLLASLYLDVMRFRFLWITLALGIAAAVCAREETSA
jgi:hypothetical protein